VELLFTSALQKNAWEVENSLQRHFQSLPLLGRELWRCLDNGAKYVHPTMGTLPMRYLALCIQKESCDDSERIHQGMSFRDMSKM